jgi:hypothetical protein
MTLLALSLLLAAAPTEKLPDGVKLTKVEAFPPAIRITSSLGYAQVVLTGVTADGARLDVTRMAEYAVPAAITLSDTGMARPAADGKGALTARVGGMQVEVPVHVSGQKEAYEASFSRDVMPILSRLGCNAGTCHGAEAGRGGFKLSLRGYDPLFDHRALTDDLAARRVNRAAPARSLMLLKMSGGVPHQGGVLAQPGQPYYEAVHSWITAGGKFDPKAARVKSIEVRPASAVLPLPGHKQQLAVIAKYEGGGERDVTAEAFLEPSNIEIASVSREATVTALRRGESAIMARYEGAYAAATVIVMGKRDGFAWKAPPTHNWIDELVDEKLQAVKVLPSGLCTDGEFLRRAYIDLTGTLPPVEAARAFLDDPTPSKQKREKLIDALIGSDDFVEHWTNKWADLLQVNRKFLGESGARAFREHIKKAVAENKPYDQLVRDILTASGPTIDKPAAAYYKVLRTPDAVMENTTQLFLGVRFNCNKCHDHPFERWTQDQYYQLAAYFARVTRSEDPRYKGQRLPGTDVEGGKPLVEVISDSPGGEVTHARTNAVTPPAFPYPIANPPSEKLSRREQAALWITSPHNPYFARSYVNRLWAYMTGVGLIEPIDDLRAGNPPTNPKLLDRLTEEFIKSGFDTRHMLKLIARSRTYQLSVAANKWNEDDSINYARAASRRLPAEVLYDAIHRATGAPSRLPGLPSGARAAALLDSAQDAPGGFLDLLGKPPRESACECERGGGLQLGPVLALVNGPVVGEAVHHPGNRISALLRKEKDTGKIVEELYLAFLCRKPTARELAASLAAIKEAEEDYDEQMAKHRAARQAVAAHEKTQAARQAAWEAGFSKKVDWSPVTFVSGKTAGAATIQVQPDGSLLVIGAAPPARELYTVTVETPLKEVTGIRLEVLPDDRLPGKGPGRAENGNFVLNELRLQAMEIGGPGKPGNVALFNAQATFSQGGFPIAQAIDNNPATGWAIAPQMGKATEALFQLKAPLRFAKGARLTMVMDQRYGTSHVIGKFRISVTGARGNLSLGGPPPGLAEALAVEPAKRSPQQKATLEAAFRAQDQELQRLLGELAKAYEPADRRHPGVQDLVWALINSKAFQFNH